MAYKKSGDREKLRADLARKGRVGKATKLPIGFARSDFGNIPAVTGSRPGRPRLPGRNNGRRRKQSGASRQIGEISRKKKRGVDEQQDRQTASLGRIPANSATQLVFCQNAATGRRRRPILGNRRRRQDDSRATRFVRKLGRCYDNLRRSSELAKSHPRCAWGKNYQQGNFALRLGGYCVILPRPQGISRNIACRAYNAKRINVELHSRYSSDVATLIYVAPLVPRQISPARRAA